MSGPNTDYDPVQVTPLGAAEVERMRAEALADIAAADSPEALRVVRQAHASDRSPLALANREIGALPPQARKEAGMRVGRARRQVTEALTARQRLLDERAQELALQQEAVDVTVGYDRDPRGSRHPLTTLQERIADMFVAMGWEIAEGPEVEA